MKNFVPKRAVSALIAGMMITAPAAPMISRTVITVSAAKQLTTSPSHTQEVGWYNDYHHEIWQADTPNSSTMTLHDNDGGFSTSWKCGPNNSRGNFLARRGLYWGLNNPKTYKNYGNFYCDYDCSWYAGSSGNSRICIYGWAQNPLVEYYIIEGRQQEFHTVYKHTSEHKNQGHNKRYRALQGLGEPWHEDG